MEVVLVRAEEVGTFCQIFTVALIGLGPWILQINFSSGCGLYAKIIAYGEKGYETEARNFSGKVWCY